MWICLRARQVAHRAHEEGGSRQPRVTSITVVSPTYVAGEPSTSGAQRQSQVG